VNQSEGKLCMNKYTANIILNPELSDERVKTVLSLIEELVKKGKGEWGEVEEWGRKRLSYRINKKSEGLYYLLSFSANQTVCAEIEKKVKEKDDTLRLLIEKQ